jgi:hypothetical protein
MSKTQLKVLWLGIGFLGFIGLFPPESPRGCGFLLQDASVSLGRLVIECGIVVVVTGGLICSLRVDPDLLQKTPKALDRLIFENEVYGEASWDAK